jgi:hypothetical protein
LVHSVTMPHASARNVRRSFRHQSDAPGDWRFSPFPGTLRDVIIETHKVKYPGWVRVFARRTAGSRRPGYVVRESKADGEHRHLAPEAAWKRAPARP